MITKRQTYGEIALSNDVIRLPSVTATHANGNIRISAQKYTILTHSKSWNQLKTAFRP